MGPPVKLMLKGQPVFLCCSGCKKEAGEHPDQTLAKVTELKARSKAGQPFSSSSRRALGRWGLVTILRVSMSGSMPRAARSISRGAAAAQACGLPAVGYSTGKGPTSRE